MRLHNHIARRFLTDNSIVSEILDKTYPEIMRYANNNRLEDIPSELGSKWLGLDDMLKPTNNTSYWITDTVFSKLDMLKLNKKKDESGDHYDWTVFKNITDRKITMIFPDNERGLMRVMFTGDKICFIHLFMADVNLKQNYGMMNWVMYYVDRNTGEQCEHFQHNDVKRIERLSYALLCFMYLTENDEVILKPGAKHGTMESGKIINDLPVPLTIVNSRWNTTVSRTDEFGVRGHFAIRWAGQGRSEARLVFIEPFTKTGYTRKAANNIHQ